MGSCEREPMLSQYQARNSTTGDHNLQTILCLKKRSEFAVQDFCPEAPIFTVAVPSRRHTTIATFSRGAGDSVDTVSSEGPSDDLEKVGAGTAEQSAATPSHAVT